MALKAAENFLLDTKCSNNSGLEENLIDLAIVVPKSLADIVRGDANLVESSLVPAHPYVIQREIRFRVPADSTQNRTFR